ncbi:FAD-dependent oxidoreductase [Corynebacterium aquilae]|uniref:ferredoxin--NADP(+) reductase n=1 Tax=Corynebacterium aquilae DSM 44791 TaxID=1431546 RepID=A0A1L7CI48_9CORY|nr:FAD-dependent oxidoreductase [Corynebacterium aquilae]APT85536.1 pyridine nucleotide-disulfide oxidoreductase [Corynebacterium aquilae DSM 44791]
MSRPLRVAVIGAGPAGIYASDLLMKSDTPVEIDLYERMPAPFGLIRYGVAPDHPRIKGIVNALHKVMEKDELRLLGNIAVGEDVTIDELKQFYDALVFSTGATGDRDLDIPGSDLEGSYGAAEFVGFYDGNPDFKREWDLSAEKVAVVGVGNVGLDVARILAKTGEELHVTEIPDNVYEVLKTNQAKEVHVFGRRGPAQAKFTPLELKELDHSPTIEVVVNPEDIDYDEASEAARRESKTQDMVCSTLEQYAIRDPKGAPHKLFIHFFESPVEILGEDGRVVALKTERTQLDGNGGVTGTGEYTEWPVGAVYRAVGYRSDAVTGVPFDPNAAVIPNDGGHVLTEPNGEIVPGLYTTGWIKRGPVGLIGNTKGDAKETIEMLLADYADGKLDEPAKPEKDDVITFLEDKGLAYTTWDGWHQLDAEERRLGEAEGRERKKIVEWDEMVKHSRKDA